MAKVPAGLVAKEAAEVNLIHFARACMPARAQSMFPQETNHRKPTESPCVPLRPEKQAMDPVLVVQIRAKLGAAHARAHACNLMHDCIIIII